MRVFRDSTIWKYIKIASYLIAWNEDLMIITACGNGEDLVVDDKRESGMAFYLLLNP